MSDDDSAEEEYTMDDIDEDLREAYGDLMDVNHKIIRRSRRQAAAIDKIIELYASQISRLSDIRDLHIEGAQRLSETISDILAAEWDINDDDTEEDEGDE